MESENLFPDDGLDIEEEEFAEMDDEETPVGYLESIYFDESVGDFSRNGQNQLIGSTRIEAWKQWCVNCIMTERDAYPAYGSSFGVSTTEAVKAETQEECENILAFEIEEALLNDPYGRTETVEEIEFNWLNTNQLEVTVTVNGIDDVSIDLEVTIDMRAR